MVACALAGAAPALAGDPPDAPGPAAVPAAARTVTPEHSSDGEQGPLAAPFPAYRLRPVVTQRAVRRVAPGVTFTRWSQTDARGPVSAHLLTIDPATRGLRIDYGSGGPVSSVTPLKEMLRKDGAIAGINGDFFDIGRTGAPLGVGKDRQRGLLHAREDGWNDAFFVDRQGRARIGNLPMLARIRHHPELRVTNLNSAYVAPGRVGVYTPQWGRTAGYQVTQGQTRSVRAVTVEKGRVTSNRRKLTRDRPIRGLLLVGRGASADQLRKLRTGSKIRLERTLRARPLMALSGNKALVDDGVVRVGDDRELHPRTAVGVDADTGEVLMLVVDGRQQDSRGLTMVELADMMIDLGADEALNLDGGGSSTIVANDSAGRLRVLNDPSDGRQRSVANGLAVSYRRR